MPGGTGDDAVLEQALRDLMDAWKRTEDRWRDSARSDFERECLAEIHQRATLATRAIKQLEQLLREAMHACHP